MIDLVRSIRTLVARVLVCGCATALLAQRTADLRVDVTLVAVPLIVTDHRGVPVRDLRKEELSLREEGVEQRIKYLWQQADLPLTVGLIVDVSSSQTGLVRRHREDMERFVRQVIGPGDQAFVVTLDEQPRLLVDLTDSAEELQAGVAHLTDKSRAGEPFGEPCVPPRGQEKFGTRACAGTAIWDGVYHAAEHKLKGVRGRKALILVSDGLDLHSSRHTLQDAIEEGQSARAPIYTIRYLSAPYLAISGPLMLGAVLDSSMKKLAEETGGRGYGNPGDKTGEVFTEIEEELRSQYIVAYTPDPVPPTGKFRKLEIRTSRRNAKLRMQKGYIAQ